jgi:hypothetical protein
MQIVCSSAAAFTCHPEETAMQQGDFPREIIFRRITSNSGSSLSRMNVPSFQDARGVIVKDHSIEPLLLRKHEFAYVDQPTIHSGVNPVVLFAQSTRVAQMQKRERNGW